MLKFYSFLFLIAFSLSAFVIEDKPKFRTQNGTAYFYSSAPLEDIEATSKNLVGVLVPETGRMAFAIIINSFSFKNKLMQKHFNEDYLESDKYPKATFVGKIQESINYSKDTLVDVTLKGTLNIHGIEQERELVGKIKMVKGKLEFTSNFEVALEDHDIKVPKLLLKNIAEVIEVTVYGEMELK